MHRKLIVLPAALLLASCTATHRTHTVGRAHAAGELSLGGPITTALDAPAPMPVLFLGGRYGLRDDMDISLGYNLTAPLVPSIPMHLEAGLHWAPIQPGLMEQPDDQGWSVVTDAKLVWLSDFETGNMFIPGLGVTGAYRYRFVAPYVGVMAAYNGYRPFERSNWLSLAPHVGLEFMAGEHYRLTLEASWLEAAANTYGSGLQWIYLVENDEEDKWLGAFTPMIGMSWDVNTRPKLSRAAPEAPVPVETAPEEPAPEPPAAEEPAPEPPAAEEPAPEPPDTQEEQP